MASKVNGRFFVFKIGSIIAAGMYNTVTVSLWVYLKSIMLSKRQVQNIEHKV